MAYHKIYDSLGHGWGTCGWRTGSFKGGCKEVKEESGVVHVRPLLDNPFSIEVLTVDGHEKQGAYVSSHLHLNVTYLLERQTRQIHCRKRRREQRRSMVWVKRSSGSLSYRTLVPEACLWETQ